VSLAQIRTGALSLSLIVGLLGCRTSESAGEFEDDAGQDEAEPPDLPQPECDPRRSDDCPSGQKCSYVADGEFGPTDRCVELLGEKLEGESCVQIGDSDDCAAQRICWATDADGNGGICVGFCDTGLTCELDGELCSVANGGLLPLCLPRCNPLVQDCIDGWGCYPDPGQRWVCDLDRSGAAGAHGEACECINCCDPGLACMAGVTVDAEGCGGDGAAGCCAVVCNTDAVEDSCPTELEDCDPFYEPDALLMGYENVGICQR
jgi:hypothetical protein